MFVSTHTVQAGDTLSAIAAQSGVSLAALESANSGISNPNVIYAGQQVAVPSGGSFTQWTPAPEHHYSVSSQPSSSGQSSSQSSASSSPSSGRSSKWTPPASHTQEHSSSQSSQGSTRSVASQNTSTPTTGGSDIDNIPGVPQSFVKCVAFRESTNGTNAAFNGGDYGIITASGHNVNGQSLGAQKQAFKEIYDTTGPSAWAADGCPGT
jgi:LysM domain